jgi:hypothetical protein
MAGNTTNYTTITDFNTNPYYDDYDADKGFYRILYKPGIAVQARELTQTQTMLQTQIDRFAEHIFKEGSLVSGGLFSIDKNIDYVKINDTDNIGNPITLNNYVGSVITGATNSITAYVVAVADGSQSDINKTKTLFVKYTSSGTDGVTNKFVSGEVLSSGYGNLTVHSDASAIGIGSMFTINDGIVFSKDHFIKFPKQTIILERYSNTPTCRVGFDVLESIVTSADDSTLNDPAMGAYNFNAPGADRFKLDAVLTLIDIDDVAGPPNFVQLFIIKDGVVQVSNEKTEYSLIRDELAGRTYDESGDYYVRGLSVAIREHLDNGTNQGVYPAPEGNTNLLVAAVAPGKAYVKGYDVETLVTKNINVRKGVDFNSIENQIISTRMGNYVVCNELVGSWDLNNGDVITIYDAPQLRITSGGGSTAAQTGNVIGTAKLRGIELVEGNPGSPTAKYNVYLFDIKMSSNSFASARSIYKSNSGTASIGADIVVPSSNVASVNEVAYDSMLYPIIDYVRSLRDSSNNVDTTYNFKKSFPVSISSTGTFNISTGLVDEIFPYSVGSLTDIEKSDIIISLNAAATKSMAGTVTTYANTTINGTSTKFTYLNPGDRIKINTVSGVYYVDTIESDIKMTVTANTASAVSAQTYVKQYNVGDVLNLMGNGADAGLDRTVTLNTSTSMSFDLKETLSSTVSATATIKLSKTTAREIAKILRPHRYVKINCSTAGTTGPFNLGFSDVYKIRSIRKNTGDFTSATQGTDVTASFVLDNGQRDFFYDNAKIIPNITLASSDYLLIELDYFEPDFTQGLGYFSVDSYPVNDSTTSDTTIKTQEIPTFTSPIDGFEYDLRICVDFRPVRTNTATSATTVAAATINPAASTTFAAPAGGLHLPAPNGEFVFDYSNYLSRKDIVIMDSLGKISVIEGTPSVVPITPSTPDNSMALATLNITPYPSLSPVYAAQLGKTDMASTSRKTSFVRSTMRDIAVIKDRVASLEYYSRLNLLEKQAADMNVLDENGLDRFKNGIFVDTFRDHTNGDVSNPDYKIVVDPKEQSIRPYYNMESVPYEFISGSGISATNNLITMTYTEEVLFSQPYATTTRNIENNVYRYIGLVTLDPESDVWVDTEQMPDEIIQGEVPEYLPPVQTEWNQWQTAITGYNVYHNVTGALLGTFYGDNALSDANKLIKKYTTKIASERTTQGGTGHGGGAGGGHWGGAGHNITTYKTVVNATASAITESVRTGVELVPEFATSTENLGNKTVNTSIIPYIRPQIIKVFCRDLKPNTRLWIYFDETPMSDYLTPTDSDYVVVDGVSEGSTWRTDADGKAYGLLRLPSEGKRFYTGTKKVRVSDSPTNSGETTTFGNTYFVAQGLLQQQQNTILSTYKVVMTQDNVTQTTTKVNGSVISDTITSSAYQGADCMGYTFMVNAPQNEDGVFLTSFDVFMADKHPTLGVWFELREVDNAGGITRNTVPYSVVSLEPDDMPTSEDASVPLNVKFKCPVFLYNNTEYALILHATAMNPDTYFWTCELGQDDVITGQKVVNRKQTGTLFDTNNNVDWVPVPNQDLKVTFYRANFNTGIATVTLGTASFERFLMSSVSAPFETIGEIVRGQTTLTLTSSSTSIVTGDIIIGQESAATATVSNVLSSNYTLAANTIQKYKMGEVVTIKDSSNVTKGTASISDITYPTGTLYSYKNPDASTVQIQLRNITGDFPVSSTIIGELSGNYGVIQSKQPIKYSVVDFEPNNLVFSNTALTYSMKTTSNTNVMDTNFAGINAGDNTTLADEKVLLGRTQENSLISGNKSNQVQIVMNSNSSYVSPVIDLHRTHGVFVHNVVNFDFTDEDKSSGGNSWNKYISKVVTLAEGQDAEDLQVHLTAYRPPSTDIKVYAKIVHAEDSDDFASHNWIELVSTNNSYSSTSNTNDFMEFAFGFNTELMTGLYGAVEYTNSNGVAFSGYKQFAIKIVLGSYNSASVPRVADLQCLCLQM